MMTRKFWLDLILNKIRRAQKMILKWKKKFIHFFCHSFSFHSRYDINLRWIKITSYFEFQLWIQNMMFFALNSFLSIASLYIYCIFRDIRSENYRAIDSQSSCFRFQYALFSLIIQNWKKIHLQIKIVWEQSFTLIIHIWNKESWKHKLRKKKSCYDSSTMRLTAVFETYQFSKNLSTFFESSATAIRKLRDYWSSNSCKKLEIMLNRCDHRELCVVLKLNAKTKWRHIFFYS